MIKQFFRTNNDFSLTIMRLALGIVILPHGLQKVAGMFGGNGFQATMQHFTENMSFPWIVALLVILAESAGALGLIIGFCTRLCALGIGAVMTGAIVMVHWKIGFFMNWSGNQAGEGFEFHILAIGLAIALLIRGGGALSIDRSISGY
jgi:putative oxidoreductase